MQGCKESGKALNKRDASVIRDQNVTVTGGCTSHNLHTYVQRLESKY